MDTEQRSPKLFYGWYIVIACALITFYTSGVVIFGFTAAIDPIAEEFGWSYALISLAFSLRGFEMGLLAPLMGILVDRFGPRRLIFGGSILTCLGFLFLSRVSSLAMFYGALVVIAAGRSTCSPTVIQTAVVNWFRRKVGMAAGIVASGMGLGGLMVPVVTGLIDSLQWRTAMLIAGLGMLATVLPLSFVVRHKPEQYGYQPDGDVTSTTEIREFQIPTAGVEFNVLIKRVLSSRAFWHIAISSMCHSFVIGAVVIHIMPYLSSLGVARSVSSMVALVLPVASIFGRLSGGWLNDRLGSREIFAASFALMTAGMLFFGYVTPERMWLLAPFIITLGLGWGSSVTTRITLVREHYGRGSFGRILGFTSGMMMLGTIIGAPLAGWVFDTWGSYQGAWLSYSAVTLAGVILVLTIPPVQR
ncbi:MFS transporter [Chloroflexota bacterium]